MMLLYCAGLSSTCVDVQWERNISGVDSQTRSDSSNRAERSLVFSVSDRPANQRCWSCWPWRRAALILAYCVLLADLLILLKPQRFLLENEHNNTSQGGWEK